MTHILVLKNLSIGTDDKQILHRASLTIQNNALTAFMGPMGSGKSTLLSFLANAGVIDGLEIRSKSASYRNRPLGPENRPTIIYQKVREQSKSGSAALLQKRLAEIQNVIESSDGLLCIDEPTAGLEPNDGDILMNMLRAHATKCAVLIVSHNKDEIQRFADHIVLIAGGRAVTSLPVEQFFDGETDEYATHYLKTGGLDIPYENTPTLFLAPESRIAPDGFNLKPANPSIGVENWIIDRKFSLIAVPISAGGELDQTCLRDLSPARHVYHFDLQGLTVFGENHEIIRQHVWQNKDQQPDRNVVLSTAIAREIDQTLTQGIGVTFNTSFNQNAGAAILGTFLIHRNFSPADALEMMAGKYPELHFGMRLEQFLWDIDIELSMN